MRCFLDIDGVLCDWTGTMHRRLGIAYDYANWPYAKGPDGWYWHNDLGWSFDAVSQLCDFEFWVNASETHDGREIMTIVRRYFELNEITLLTAPMPNVMSASGKVEWVRRHYPEFERRMMVCTASKAILAALPGSLLIDDGPCNIRDWTAAGGRAITVPRWWNTEHHLALKSASVVEKHLEKG